MNMASKIILNNFYSDSKIFFTQYVFQYTNTVLLSKKTKQNKKNIFKSK